MMISKFITAVPRNGHFQTRCFSATIARFATNHGSPEKTQKPFRGNRPTDKRTTYHDLVKTNESIMQKKVPERKTPLPEYPQIEGIKRLEVESFSPSNFVEVKYGDYTFVECKEGYVQVHVKGWANDRDVSNPVAGYGYCFGKADHPLNSCGPVIGKQTDNHANLYATVLALRSLPKDLFKKVCICTDSLRVVQVMSNLLPQWSENNYRQLGDPSRVCENLPTLRELNEFVRLNPFTYRVKYTPSDCCISMMTIATKLAKKGANE